MADLATATISRLFGPISGHFANGDWFFLKWLQNGDWFLKWLCQPLQEFVFGQMATDSWSVSLQTNSCNGWLSHFKNQSPFVKCRLIRPKVADLPTSRISPSLFAKWRLIRPKTPSRISPSPFAKWRLIRPKTPVAKSAILQESRRLWVNQSPFCKWWWLILELAVSHWNNRLILAVAKSAISRIRLQAWLHWSIFHFVFDANIDWFLKCQPLQEFVFRLDFPSQNNYWNKASLAWRRI